MKTIFTKIIDALTKFNIYFMASCAALLFTLVVLQVVFRFFIHYSIAWSEELSRFLGVWLVFFGATLAVKEESHLGIDFLINRFPYKLKIINRKFIQICILGYAIVLTYEGILWLKMVTIRESLVLQINMFWIYLPVVFCTFLMVLYLIYILLKKIDSNSFKCTKAD